MYKKIHSVEPEDIRDNDGPYMVTVGDDYRDGKPVEEIRVPVDTNLTNLQYQILEMIKPGYGFQFDHKKIAKNIVGLYTTNEIKSAIFDMLRRRVIIRERRNIKKFKGNRDGTTTGMTIKIWVLFRPEDETKSSEEQFNVENYTTNQLQRMLYDPRYVSHHGVIQKFLDRKKGLE